MNPNRLDQIFQCIVEAYIESAEPVGSRTVSQRYEGNLSPATIRNVMGELEEIGYIAQPHTSAGRVPTDKGYRHYVDSLIEYDEAGVQVPDIAPLLRNAADIEEAAERLSRLLAELTGNAGILYLKNAKRLAYLSDLKREMRELREKLSSRGLKPNDRLYVDGTSNIVHQPEFKEADAIRALLKQLESKESLASLLEKDLDQKKVHVHIGAEVKAMQLPNVSIVVKEYSIDGVPVGCLAVMGPTRMKYDQTIGVVTKLSDAMTEFLNDL